MFPLVQFLGAPPRANQALHASVTQRFTSFVPLICYRTAAAPQLYFLVLFKGRGFIRIDNYTLFIMLYENRIDILRINIFHYKVGMA